MKIGFCQIVKNEAHVIERCLDSVKDFIDYVYISDTGSTDNTIQVINNWLKINNIEGQVVTHKWKNFAHNRSIVLKELKEKNIVDYILMIDADEVLVFDKDPKQLKETLKADIYDILTVFPHCSYFRPQLTSTRLPVYYKGIVHEFLESDVPWNTRENLSGVYNRPIQDSNRNKIGNKTKHDAELLEHALEVETDSFLKIRYTFYLARSLVDCNEKRKALIYFEKRANMGGWDQEVYISWLEVGKLREELNYFPEDILSAYYKAFELIPTRLEAIYHIVHYCRNHKRHGEGFYIGKAGYGLRLDSSALFSDPSIYKFKFMDECAINAYWFGKYKESLEIYELLIKENKVPDDQMARVVQNMQYARERL
jgi:glycosyltransferase involved in cell wall biosynthesis